MLKYQDWSQLQARRQAGNCCLAESSTAEQNHSIVLRTALPFSRKFIEDNITVRELHTFLFNRQAVLGGVSTRWPRLTDNYLLKVETKTRARDRRALYRHSIAVPVPDAPGKICQRQRKKLLAPPSAWLKNKIDKLSVNQSLLFRNELAYRLNSSPTKPTHKLVRAPNFWGCTMLGLSVISALFLVIPLVDLTLHQSDTMQANKTGQAPTHHCNCGLPALGVTQSTLGFVSQLAPMQ